MAAALPDNVTGADIGAVTASAFSAALTRKLQTLTRVALRENEAGTDGEDEGDDGDEEWDDAQCWQIKAHIGRQDDSELAVEVRQGDLLQAAQTAVPTAIDLAYYEGLGRRYDDQMAAGADGEESTGGV